MDVHNGTSPTYQGIHLPNSPRGNNEIIVRIIMDSQAPLSMKLPASLGSQLTLGQFKALASLTREHYKFYFKSQDSEFGTVKEELVDDESSLPVDDTGEIVVWVITNDQVHSTLFEDVNDDPAGEPYRMQSSAAAAQNNHYHFDQVDNASSPHGVTRDYGYHTTRAMVPPQSQYASQGNCITVDLFLDLRGSLGLTLICPSDDLQPTGSGICVDKVQPNSVAGHQGQIGAGDRIVEINGYDLRGLRTSEAIIIFKRFVDRKGAISLVVAKSGSRIYDYRPQQERDSTGSRQVARSQTSVANTSRSAASNRGFDPATELPAPVVETAMTGPAPAILPPMTNRALPKVKSHRATYSLPRSLTPRSLYTTSGNYDTTMTSSADYQLYPLDSKSVYEPTTPNSVRQISVALHCGKDDIYTIYTTLKSDAASLDIRDRDWLKVIVKDAFLGSTLVKWLSRNVYGFCNRSEVKRFANQMLSLGLIKSPMSNSSFSEKCYYTLT